MRLPLIISCIAMLAGISIAIPMAGECCLHEQALSAQDAHIFDAVEELPPNPAIMNADEAYAEDLDAL